MKQCTDIEAVQLVCKYWNKKDVVKHRVFTDKMRRKIKTALKSYTLEEVLKAIFNYATILHDTGYFWTYRWTLHDFIQRGLEKFMDEAYPYDNFKSSHPVSPDRPKKEDNKKYTERFVMWQQANPSERRRLEEQWKEELR